MQDTSSETSTTSRRAFLSTAAVAIPAIAAAPMAALAGTEPDPIFKLIEAHKSAQAEYEAACEQYSDMELSIAKPQRKGVFNANGVTVDTGDDPRWTEACIRFHHAYEVADTIAFQLANAEPTTIAGVAAVLKYASEFTEKGHLWPDEYSSFTDDSVCWEHQLNRTLASAVARLAA